MCGIFGWVGKNPKKFSKDKFNILGLYNVERGKHSCGVSVDADIKIGLKDIKLYNDFIETLEHGVETPKEVPVVIGHTRQASWGDHTVANAHPFGFGSLNGNFEFLGCHNGTLVNHEELAEKYKVGLKVTTKKDNITKIRTKIDSEVLLEIIYKSKNFKVLNDYNGAAALMFYNVNEPNTCYFYHGKSKKYDYSNDVTEERPLYYYQETRNSLYVSSMEKSLKAISDDYSKIGEFEHNIVYKVTDGNLAKAKKIKIVRKNTFQKETYSNWGNHQQYNTSGRNNVKEYNKSYSKPKKLTKPSTTMKSLNIYDESARLSTKDTGGRPYFNKLRWYRNGHLINGIYLFIPNYGFTYLSQDFMTAKEEYSKCLNKAFDKELDTFVTLVRGEEENPLFTNSNLMPFKYFQEGIMLRTRSDYEQIKDLKRMNKHFNHEQLSLASMHPIINVNSKKPSDNQEIMWNGQKFTGKIAVMGAYRVYDIKDGNLIAMNNIPLPQNFYKLPEKKKVIHLNAISDSGDYFDGRHNAILDCDCGDASCFVCQNDQDLIDDFMVLDTIDQVFEEALVSLPLAKRQLEKFVPNDYAEKAIKHIKDFTDNIMNIN